MRPTPPPQPPGPPTVALLLPLSGPAAEVGRDLLDAATLALFDAPESELVLRPLDTTGSPEGTVAAARKALQDDARLLLGPLFARSARALAPVLRPRGVLALAFSNDARVAAPPVYILGFRPEEQVARILRHARREGLGRIALLAPEDAYGRRVVEAWRRLAPTLALDPALVLTYGDDETALADQLRLFTAYDERRRALAARIEELEALADDPAAQQELAQLRARDTLGPPPFEAVLIADGGLRLRSVAALLRYYDAGADTVRLLGTMRWLEGGAAALAGRPEFLGARIAAQDQDLARAFARRFQTVYGRKPRPVAVLAYDAVAAAVAVARRRGRLEPRDLLTPQGFRGFAGILRLRPDGTAQHGLAVYEVGAEGLVLVEPAPQRFDPAATSGAAAGSSATPNQKRTMASAMR